MVKKLLTIAIVMLFIFSVAGIGYANEATQPLSDQPTEKTKDRADRAMHNILCGPLEVPKNMNETHSKGTALNKCSGKTRSGVERGIARLTAGVWQLATFWYSDPGCVTSSKQGEQGSSGVK